MKWQTSPFGINLFKCKNDGESGGGIRETKEIRTNRGETKDRQIDEFICKEGRHKRGDGRNLWEEKKTELRERGMT